MQIRQNKVYHAVITFIAKDGSHGYVKIIEHLSELTKEHLSKKSTPGYLFYCQKEEALELHQMVDVKLVKDKASIVNQLYEGIKVPASDIAQGKDWRKQSGKVRACVMPSGYFFNAMPVLIRISQDVGMPNHIVVRYKLIFRRKGVFKASEPEKHGLSKKLEYNLMMDFLSIAEGTSQDQICRIKSYAGFFSKQGSIQKGVAEKILTKSLGYFQTTADDSLTKQFIEIIEKDFGHLLSFETYQALLGSSIKVFDKWFAGKLPEGIVTPTEIIQLLGNTEAVQELSLPQLQQLFEKIVGETSYGEVFCACLQMLSVHNAFSFLEIANNGNNPEVLAHRVYEKLPVSWLIAEWLSGKLVHAPSDTYIKTCFLALTIPQKKALLQEKPLEVYGELAAQTGENNEEFFELYVQKLLAKLGETIDYCAFDLEVNPYTNVIEQLAYQTPRGKQCYDNPSDKEKQALVDELRKATLVIGHNIRIFDLPFVVDEATLELLPIWDTLEVEVLLRPAAASLALDTAHEALADVERCLQAFLLQWLACCRKGGAAKEFLRQQLPEKMESLLAASEGWMVRFDQTFLEARQAALFHSTDLVLGTKLREALPSATRLVVAPETWWHYWAFYPDLHFYSEVPHEHCLVLDEAKITNLLSTFPLPGNALLEYISLCKAKQQLPYARRLTRYLQRKVNEVTDINQLCYMADGTEREALKVCSVWYFARHQHVLQQKYKAEEICLLGVDQWQHLASRKVADCDWHTLHVQSSFPDLWANFAGGASVGMVDLSTARELSKSNELLGDWFWLLRVNSSQYELREGFRNPDARWKAFENTMLKTWTIAEAVGTKLTTHDQLAYAYMPDTLQGNFVTLNPETFYRDGYWTQKLQLLYCLWANAEIKTYSKNAPYVLLVTRESEITILVDILRKLGFYVPGHKVGLRRKMELVADKKQGLVIAGISQLDEVLSHPQRTAFTYLLENLLPDGMLHLTGITREQEAANEAVNEETEEEEQEEKDNVEAPESLAHFGSVSNVLAKLKQHYHWLFTRILWQHPKNRLLVFDPRANSRTFGRYKVEGLAVTPALMNAQATKNKEIAKMCQARFYAPREFDIDGELEPHLKKMAAVFLKGKGDNGQAASFKENQQEYLKLIFPAQKDVLVTLPTGEGKSVLFQAPALYRSSFTNRLSIVVTPLKALMEDHILGLWKLGFWNSVEFINYDKGLEVQDIYRKIAGGELSMVFVTPERFRSNGFIRAIENRLKHDGHLEYMVFDEAHCISQWGNEFRPDYFYCTHKVKELRNQTGEKMPLLLLSATVTRQVAQHLKTALYE